MKKKTKNKLKTSFQGIFGFATIVPRTVIFYTLFGLNVHWLGSSNQSTPILVRDQQNWVGLCASKGVKIIMEKGLFLHINTNYPKTLLQGLAK